MASPLFRPSIFTNTPQECMWGRIQEVQTRAEEALTKRTNCIYDPLKPKNNERIGDGQIQVYFYNSEARIHREMLPDLVGTVTLDPSGALDLNQIRRKWGLENIMIIKPSNWKRVEPTGPNTLSCLAVYELSNGRAEPLRIIELPPSKRTVYIRFIRMFTLLPLKVALNVMHLQAQTVYHEIDKHTSLTRRYNALRGTIEEEIDNIPLTVSVFSTLAQRTVGAFMESCAHGWKAGRSGNEYVPYVNPNEDDVLLGNVTLGFLSLVFIALVLLAVLVFDIGYPVGGFLYHGWTMAGDSLWIGTSL